MDGNSRGKEEAGSENAVPADNVSLNRLLAQSIGLQPQISMALLTAADQPTGASASAESTGVPGETFEEILRREKNMFPELDMDAA